MKLDKYRITDNTFVIGFLRTRKNKSVREQMINCAKSLIENMDMVKECEKTIERRRVSIICKDFAFSFNSTPYFLMLASFSKENALESVNKILNDSLDKFYEKNWKETSEAFVYYDIKAEINEKIEVFSLLVNRDTWEKLFGNDRSYEIKRLEIWQPPASGLRKGFYIRREKDAIILECIRSDLYKGKLPKDIANQFLSELKKQGDSFLEKFVGEGC